MLTVPWPLFVDSFKKSSKRINNNYSCHCRVSLTVLFFSLSIPIEPCMALVPYKPPEAVFATVTFRTTKSNEMETDQQL